MLSIAGGLFREYAESLSFSLEYQGFSNELATLPGAYAPPRGGILVAIMDGVAVGCIALRPHDDQECEIKRFFVRPSSRGSGLGRALAMAAVELARQLGYQSVCLDSSSDMLAARHVYESVGFRPCERYNDDPDPGTVYYRLHLQPVRT